MKATEKHLISPLVTHQLPVTDLGRVEQTTEVQAPASQPLGHTTVDLTEQAPVRLADAGPASSVVSTGQSSQVAIRAQRNTGRGAGVRTKKLKTENVGSLARPARALFQAVLQAATRGKQILAAKQPQVTDAPTSLQSQAVELSRE